MARKVPRALLFYNPEAPRVRRRLDRQLEHLTAACRARQVLLDATATEGPGSVLEHADSVSRRKYDLLIAWGGDGTVNEVGNVAARLKLPLGILPGGTVNILARELGIPARPEEAVAVLFNGVRRPIKAGRANERLFFAMAGVGFDAAVCRWVPPRLKRRLGRLAYVVGGLRLLFTYPFPSVSILCDTRGFTGAQIIISNLPRYAGRMRLSPLADLDGGSLDLCVLRSDSPFGYVRFLARLLVGRHTRWRELVYLKGWTFTAVSAEPVPVQLDGEYVGTLPMRFEMEPEALEVLVPAGRAPRRARGADDAPEEKPAPLASPLAGAAC